MKKIVIAAIALSSLVGAPALADNGPASPTATHDNPSSCLGAARATSNSNGGNRAHGTFGDEQAAYVAYINSGLSKYMSYGEFLQAWKASC